MNAKSIGFIYCKRKLSHNPRETKVLKLKNENLKRGTLGKILAKQYADLL